jgi:hypothetical protein
MNATCFSLLTSLSIRTLLSNSFYPIPSSFAIDLDIKKLSSCTNQHGQRDLIRAEGSHVHQRPKLASGTKDVEVYTGYPQRCRIRLVTVCSRTWGSSSENGAHRTVLEDARERTNNQHLKRDHTRLAQ